MLCVNVSVMDLTTGNERWVTLPTSDLKSLLSGIDIADTLIADTADVIPFALGNNVEQVNKVLQDCEACGLDELCKIKAVLFACGCEGICENDFIEVLESGEFSQYEVSAQWPAMTDEQLAACWLATEEYIPFGELEVGDLVPVEDKLVDFIDWDAVWDDYATHGYHVMTTLDERIIITKI